jgi:enoyl-CoA hydratase/carnithine racemase
LENAADALDMKLVYTLVPKDGSLEQLVERKARELAIQIVSRTYNTMALENQAVSDGKFNALVEERIAQIKADLPKALWN